MERQATRPAAVPTGRKRRRVSGKKPKLEAEAQAPAPDMRATRELEMAQIGLSRAEALDLKAKQPPTSELVLAPNALPRADDPLPTPSPPQSVNELMEGTLKDYEEECVEEGTAPSPLTPEAGDDDPDLDQMETHFNDLLYEACPFHPHQFIECVNPQTQFGQVRFKCPQEGCPVYLFEDSREVMIEKLKEGTHPQVRARLQQGELKCKCGLVPMMQFSRTDKNYNKVFFSCGNFVQEPCGYFQWLHGPLWCPRKKAQPSLRRWVKNKVPVRPWGHEPVPLLKKHCCDGPQPQHYGTRGPTGGPPYRIDSG